jgi:uncharacterized protein (TIRG00374 family)
VRRHLRVIFVVALTVALVALFLRQADLARVWREIRAAAPAGLVWSLAVTLLTYVLRALRWQYLLLPIGRTRFGPAFRATVIGFAVSAVIPARPGEVLRPFLLARWEGLSATATFATIILERLLDLVAVLLLFAAFLLVFDPGVGQLDPVVFRTLRTGGVAAAAAAVAALGAVYLAARRPDALGRAMLYTGRVLPVRIAERLASGVQRFAEGLAIMRQPRRLILATALSIPLWLSIALGIWLVSTAFHITMPFTGSFLVVAFLVVGVAAPTPGQVGGFHLAYKIAVVTFYGVSEERAVGAGLVLHAVSFLPVTIVGFIFMLREGLNLGDVQRLSKREETA